MSSGMTPGMTSGSGDVLGLLRAVGAGKAGSASATSGPRTGGVAEGEFAALLKRAASGELVSGIPISIDRDAGVALSEDQLARLSLAADRAEAEGIHNAVVMMDRTALLLDVKTRTIMRQLDLSQGVLSGIDGIVTIGEGAAAQATVLPPGSGLAENPSLLALLASRRQQGDGQQAGAA